MFFGLKKQKLRGASKDQSQMLVYVRGTSFHFVLQEDDVY